jgi:hypothetical protein
LGEVVKEIHVAEKTNEDILGWPQRRRQIGVEWRLPRHLEKSKWQIYDKGGGGEIAEGVGHGAKSMLKTRLE